MYSNQKSLWIEKKRNEGIEIKSSDLTSLVFSWEKWWKKKSQTIHVNDIRSIYFCWMFHRTGTGNWTQSGPPLLMLQLTCRSPSAPTWRLFTELMAIHKIVGKRKDCHRPSIQRFLYFEKGYPFTSLDATLSLTVPTKTLHHRFNRFNRFLPMLIKMGEEKKSFSACLSIHTLETNNR